MAHSCWRQFQLALSGEGVGMYLCAFKPAWGPTGFILPKWNGWVQSCILLETCIFFLYPSLICLNKLDPPLAQLCVLFSMYFPVTLMS